MPENLTPHENVDPAVAAAERVAVQSEFTAERVALNAELSPEQIRTAEITAFIADNFPECSDAAGAAAECFAEESVYADLDPDFDITTDQPFVNEVVGRFTDSEAVVADTDVLAAAAEASVVVVEERNAGAAEVVATQARVMPDSEPLVIPVVQPGEPIDPEAVVIPAVTTVTEIANAELTSAHAQAAADLVAARNEVSTGSQLVEIASGRVQTETDRNNNAVALREETQERLADAEQLQADYEALKAKEPNWSQSQLLQELLRTSENPEHQDRLTQILANISTLENALPLERRAAVSRFIENSNLDLGAANSAAVFADVFANMSASGEFTEEEIAALRRSIGASPDVQTATDARDALAAGRGTETLPDGTTRIIPYTEEAPLELAEGVEAFPNPENPENMLIKAQFSDSVLGDREYTFNCPASMSGAAATEQINFFYINAIKESCGITGGTQQGQFVTQGERQIDLSTDGLMTQAARFGRITMDELVGGVGNEAQFLNTAQIKQIRWSYQWFMPQNETSGDAAFGDNSEMARAEALGGLGRDGLIFDANGTLKEENFRRAAAYVNGQRALGATEPSYEALRAYLEGSQPEAMV